MVTYGPSADDSSNPSSHCLGWWPAQASLLPSLVHIVGPGFHSLASLLIGRERERRTRWRESWNGGGVGSEA